MELTDYPYARFNVRLDALDYSDQEYDAHLADPKWSRADSDNLVALCQRYDLRWPVFDRYTGTTTNPTLVREFVSSYAFIPLVLFQT